MRMVRLLIAACGLAIVGFAQTYTSPVPICFAFNDTPPPAAPAYVPAAFDFSYSSGAYGSLWIHFVAPVTTTFKNLEIWTAGSSFTPNTALTLTLYSTPSLGALP